jgi:hypothetical protein
MDEIDDDGYDEFTADEYLISPVRLTKPSQVIIEPGEEFIPATALDPERRAALIATGIRWYGNAAISGALTNPHVTIAGVTYPLTVIVPPQE